MTQINRQVLLASRPQDAVTPDNFRLAEAPLGPLGDGKVRIRNRYLSLDPYMRGRMSDAKSYAAPQPVGEVMIGGTVGEVVESRHPRFAAGDKVVAMGGWQEFGLSDGTDLYKVDDTHVPLSAFLGAVGMPGIAAWYGMNRIVAPKAGETIVVSSASGAVGSAAGQLAKLAGCRVVGIAGGARKCRDVVEGLGFDACVDYKAAAFYDDLRAPTPNGVDGCFENVGGDLLDTVLSRMNTFGRVAICGLIAGRDGGPLPIRFAPLLLTQRLRLQGFLVTDHMDLWPRALTQLGTLVAQGKLRYRESIASGLPSAPAAFIDLLEGRSLGKQLVKID